MKSFLQYIIESKSPLLNELEEKFSRKALYSPKIWSDMLDPTSQNIRIIYSILNKYLFGGRLRPDIQINIVQLGRRNQLPYAAAYYYRCGHFTNVRTGKSLMLLVNESGEIDPSYPHIDLTFHERPQLIYLTNLLAHEMIHEFDVEAGSALAEMLKCENEGGTYNPHGTVFGNFMNSANQFYGLNITTVSYNEEYDKHEGIRKAKTMLNPDELKDIDREDDGVCIVDEWEKTDMGDFKVKSDDYINMKKDERGDIEMTIA